jgi:hypothetical protein
MLERMKMESDKAKLEIVLNEKLKLIEKDR